MLLQKCFVVKCQSGDNLSLENRIEMSAIILTFCIVAISVTDGFHISENVMKTWKYNEFYAFRGIKYAEPPVGGLRFKVTSK